MWKKQLNNSKGFTLPELLVVLLLVCVLGTLGAKAANEFLSWQNRQFTVMELQDNLKLSSDRLEEDIRKASRVTHCREDALSLVQSKTVTYTVSADPQAEEHVYGLGGNVLYRMESGMSNRQPMTNFIQKFCVSYLDEKGTHTTIPGEVRVIDVTLKGEWNGVMPEYRKVVRLSSELYL